MNARILVLPATLFLMAGHARSAVVLTEGFDDITNLTAAGWSTINISTPVGSTTWFQGNDTVFPAQGGTVNSYIGANFNATTGSNTISSWLMTPVLDFSVPLDFSFWTRTVTASSFPDRLQVRLSTNGESDATSDFSSLLLEINPNLAQQGYPEAWTNYNININESGTGRIAFHYSVTNGGLSGANSNYIGIDTVSVNSITAVPETSNLLVLATLMTSGAFLRSRKTRR